MSLGQRHAAHMFQACGLGPGIRTHTTLLASGGASPRLVVQTRAGSRQAHMSGSQTLVSLNLRPKDLLGPVTRVKKKKKHGRGHVPPSHLTRRPLAGAPGVASGGGSERHAPDCYLWLEVGWTALSGSLSTSV